MSDTRIEDQNYQFDDPVDSEVLEDIAVDAGLFFEDRYDQDNVTGNFFDGTFHPTLNGNLKPHSSTNLRDRRRPGHLIKGYSGKIDYNSTVNYIVEQNSIGLTISTRVPNRQGEFSRQIHKDVVENAQESLEESVERHLNGEGDWN